MNELMNEWMNEKKEIQTTKQRITQDKRQTSNLSKVLRNLEEKKLILKKKYWNKLLPKKERKKEKEIIT